MIPYFLLYFFIAIKSIEETQVANTFKKGTQNILIIFLSIIIGLRKEVGCDWYQYIKLFNYFRDEYIYGWAKMEPSYFLLNTFFSRWDYGYYFINLICAIIFSYSLIKFCESLPRPWLGLCVSFPYFILVVAMGYTRQSVSIALGLLAFVALEKSQFYRSILYIILGSTFHRSGIFFLFAPLIFTFQSTKFSNIFKIIFLLPLSYYVIDSFLIQKFLFFKAAYFEQSLSSTGSYIRVILCVIPSIVFLFNSNKFKVSVITKRIYYVLGLLSIFAFIALRLSTSSTAVDRIALNLIPIQIFVASYIPDIGFLKIDKVSWKLLIILMLFCVLTVWLIFATHSHCWTPYKNLLYQFN